jgi:hypothetical protein
MSFVSRRLPDLLVDGDEPPVDGAHEDLALADRDAPRIRQCVRAATRSSLSFGK